MIFSPKSLAVCDHFSIADTGNIQHSTGIRVICFTSRVTGEQTYIQIDPYSELLQFTIQPHCKAVFLNMLSNAGFYISPLPNGVDSFFHIVLFPQGSKSLFGDVTTLALPDDADITAISSFGNKGDKDEH